MEVIASRIALDRFPGFAPVGRAIDGGVHDVNGLRILWVGRDFFKVPATSPETLVAREASPGHARIVRAEYTTEVFSLGRVSRIIFVIDEGIDHRIDAIVISWRDRDADSAAAFAGNAFIDLFPGITTVGGLKDSAAGSVGGRVDKPGWTPHVPHRRVHNL